MLFLGTVRRWWRDRSRHIFHFHDGAGWRRADPVAVGQALEQACPDYQALFDTLAQDLGKLPPGPIRDSVRDQQRAATRELAALAYRVLEIPALAPAGGGVGLTRAEVIAVLARYILFMERLAGDVAPFVTSPGAESPSRPAAGTEPSAASGGGAG